MDTIEDLPSPNSIFARSRAAVTDGRRRVLRHDLGMISRMILVSIFFIAAIKRHVPVGAYSYIRAAKPRPELVFHSRPLAF